MSGIDDVLDAEWHEFSAQLLTHLNVEDELSVVLRTHLYLEGELAALIAKCFMFPDLIDLDRYTYMQKVELVVALGMLAAEQAPALRKLNALRNRMAHRLGTTLSSNDVREFRNSLSVRDQKLHGDALRRAMTPLEELRQVSAIMVVQLYVTRRVTPRPLDLISKINADVRATNSALEATNSALEALERKLLEGFDKSAPDQE